ncbi:MAG: hypothetical protein E6J08_08735 [Chloroflexi bacterium]|nr:MAG: hypothetical protein E6J08_08735 [Chloroflexota bacterium]
MRLWTWEAIVRSACAPLAGLALIAWLAARPAVVEARLLARFCALLHLWIDGRRAGGRRKLLLGRRDRCRGVGLRGMVRSPLGQHLVHRVGEEDETDCGDCQGGGEQCLAAPHSERVGGREPGPGCVLQRVAAQRGVEGPPGEAPLPGGREPLLESQA